MANEKQDDTLHCLFDKALALHEELSETNEPTNSDPVQEKVKKGILMLEDATRLVSILDIFSRNEHFSEILTDHLKYLLLPVLLGDLNNKLVESERREVIETVVVYYRDYLERCKDYGLTEAEIPKVKDPDEKVNKSNGGRPDLAKMNAEREAKMARYKQMKQLEEDLKRLKLVVAGEATRDEDVMREFYLKMIQKFVNVSLDEMNGLSMEMDMVRHMEMIRAGKIVEEKKVERRKLKPIIITKDKLQKEVYGLGYPSLPVMSIEEFYDDRVRTGWWEDQAANSGHHAHTQPPKGQSLQEWAEDPDGEAFRKEEEEREKEEAVERDDEEALAKARSFDDWKDEHRRGEGNRKNMG